MPETYTVLDRLSYRGDITPLVERICNAYEIGSLQQTRLIEQGYEDCNVVIETAQAKFVAKMFAKSRTPDEIQRYVDIMRHVVSAGVRHPEILMDTAGDIVHRDGDVELVLMRYVSGKTFLELDRVPFSEERHEVLRQAAVIHTIPYKPQYIHDDWAIPNIHVMFQKTKQYIDPKDQKLVMQTMGRYDTVPIASLPHCLVHGDITKANVIKADDSELYVLDFSVANYYPRIQELAVIIANLLHGSIEPVVALSNKVADEYSQFNLLTSEERVHLPAIACAAMAMEFMGAHQEKYGNGNDSKETNYWLELGRSGLLRAYAEEIGRD